jgi:hypothetical protein
MECVSEERVAPEVPKLRGIGTKEGPLRIDSEFLRSVRTQLATVLDALRVTVYAIRYLWPEMLSRDVSQYLAITILLVCRSLSCHILRWSSYRRP